MANLSFVQIAGLTGNTNFAFSFPYISKADIHVKIATVETFAFTWLNASTVQLTVPLAGNALVEIRRLTPNATQAVIFNNGSSLTQSDLNNSDLQKLYINQEIIDFESNAITLDSAGKWDAQSKVIENLGTPTNAPDAATKAYVDSSFGLSPGGHAIGAHSDSVSTTLAKGDLLVVKDEGSGVLKYDKIAVGSNGQVIVPDSAVTTGMRWVQLGQVATVGGTPDVITLTPTPVITSYVAGQDFWFVASGANTVNVTVAVSGLSALAVTKNGTVALLPGDIAANSLVHIRCDGTRFQILSLSMANLASPNIVTGTVSANPAAALGIAPKQYVDAAISHVNEFRLTLSTGVPVTTADVLAAGTLFCTPYVGNRMALYDGTLWNMRASAEFSLALTLTNAAVYDVFCFDNAGVPTLELLVWTNSTTRATALVYQDGVLVKSGATTRRYLGTLNASATNQTEDSYLRRYLWNYYNRAIRPMAFLKTATWVYTNSAYQQAGADTNAQLSVVIGLQEDEVAVQISASCNGTNAGCQLSVAVGLDSTTAPAAKGMFPQCFIHVVGNPEQLFAFWKGFTGIGRHALVWLEYSTAGTNTWQGDQGSPSTMQSGITGSVRG